VTNLLAVKRKFFFLAIMRLTGGTNLYHVKELLGHESLATVRHYANLSPSPI
jgi:site-specific recombinase XerD